MTGLTSSLSPEDRRHRPGQFAPELLVLGLVAAVVLRPYLAGLFDDPTVQMWSTVFVSITIQALPFLVLGVTVSGAVAARPADSWLEVTGRWEPRPGHDPGTLSTEPPLIVAEQVRVIPAPDEPYEY